MSNIKPKILFASFEATPFSKTGGLGDVAGSLPEALQKAYCNVRVILPKLRSIPEEYKSAMVPVCNFEVPLGWRRQYCGIEKLVVNGVIHYFIDNEYYFGRDSVYGYPDDGERVAYFSKAILEALQYIDFFPEIIHANDWHTALIPVFLGEHYMDIPEYRDIKTVFTIHNIKFQGYCSRHSMGDLLGLDHKKNAVDQLSWKDDGVNFMQGALYYADKITTVSPTYAEEICTPAYGDGMDGILRNRRERLSGILNGIAVDRYDPEKAEYPFTAKDLSGKAECKRALQEELGLPVRKDVPLIVMISRLTDQKGMDLLAGIMGSIIDWDVQLAVLGTGDKRYEDMMGGYSSAYSDKIAMRCQFDEPLSGRMYAAADILLMPSLFEPCGLNQMIAMRYGTLPLVRETGGLKDSVVPYNRYTGEGTGFSFSRPTSEDLRNCLYSAVDVYNNEPAAWKKLMQNAMKQDFSWTASAKEYRKLYRSLL